MQPEDFLRDPKTAGELPVTEEDLKRLEHRMAPTPSIRA